MKKIIKIDVINKVYWILIFIAIILNSSYAYMSYNDTLAIITLAIITMLMMLMNTIKGIRYLKQYEMYIAFFLLWIILCMAFHEDINIWGAYLREVCIILCAYLIVKVIDFYKFCQWYIIFLRISCIASLIMYILVNIIHATQIFPSFTNTNGVTFFSIIIAFVHAHAPMRCMGPFWEPGIFASFLVIGIILELCFVQRRWADIILFYFLIIMTLSTAGYILGILAFIMGISKKKNSIRIYILDAIIIVAIILTLIFSSDILLFLAKLMPEVFGKMITESTSMTTRLNGPLIDLEIWCNNILFGAGIQNYQSLWDIGAIKYHVGSRTSTLTYFVAVFGLPGIWYVMSVIRGCYRQKNINIFSRSILLCIFGSILTKEPHYYNLLMMIFIIYLNIYKPSKNLNRTK